MGEFAFPFCLLSLALRLSFYLFVSTSVSEPCEDTSRRWLWMNQTVDPQHVNLGLSDLQTVGNKCLV